MTISSTLCKYAIKAAGAAGVGILAYDAHKNGKLYGKIRANKKNYEALDYYYENSRNVPSGSYFNSKLKDKIFKWELHNTFRGFVNKGIGYVQGAAQMLMDDIVPLGLSVAAMLTRGTAAKVSGAALGLYGAYAFTKNILGIGMSNKVSTR